MQAPEKIDTDEVCENCQSPDVTQYDVEFVPFCQKCWDEWTNE